MKKKTNLKKALLTLVLALSVLPILPGTLPPTNPVPGEPDPGDRIEGEEEPGVEPLNDNDPDEKSKK